MLTPCMLWAAHQVTVTFLLCWCLGEGYALDLFYAFFTHARLAGYAREECNRCKREARDPRERDERRAAYARGCAREETRKTCSICKTSSRETWRTRKRVCKNAARSICKRSWREAHKAPPRWYPSLSRSALPPTQNAHAEELIHACLLCQQSASSPNACFLRARDRIDIMYCMSLYVSTHVRMH